MNEGLEYNGAVLTGSSISVDGGDFLRATTPEEQEAMIIHKEPDPWNECGGDNPVLPEPKQSQYIVEGSRGVCLAFYHQRLDGAWVFQDAVTGDDEGMRGRGDKPFTVDRWTELPKGKNNI